MQFQEESPNLHPDFEWTYRNQTEKMKKTKWIWIWAVIGLVLGIIIFWPSNKGNKEAILEASAVEEVVDTTEQQQIHYKYLMKILL